MYFVTSVRFAINLASLTIMRHAATVAVGPLIYSRFTNGGIFWTAVSFNWWLVRNCKKVICKPFLGLLLASDYLYKSAQWVRYTKDVDQAI